MKINVTKLKILGKLLTQYFTVTLQLTLVIYTGYIYKLKYNIKSSIMLVNDD